MKIKNLFLLIAGTAILLSSCDQKMTGNAKMESGKDSLSYMLGVDIGKSIKNASFQELDYDNFVNGVMDAFEERDLKVDEKEVKPYIQEYLQVVRAEQAKLADEKGLTNLEEGRAFLEENKKREEIITTPSGLQYEIITEGTGKSPVKTDQVKCHYHGTTLDGTVFDSSVEKGTPATFGLTRVIPGWIEGLQLMKEGAKYKFYIPTELAYGKNVRPGGTIEQNMALIFEVELIEVMAPEQKGN